MLDQTSPAADLLSRVVEALSTVGCCTPRSWGTQPLYAEGDDERVSVHRTPGKGLTDSWTYSAREALVKAGFKVTMKPTGGLFVRELGR